MRGISDAQYSKRRREELRPRPERSGNADHARRTQVPTAIGLKESSQTTEPDTIGNVRMVGDAVAE
jgi:hypothetical protein